MICNNKPGFDGLTVTERDKPTKTTTKVPVPFVVVGAGGYQKVSGLDGRRAPKREKKCRPAPLPLSDVPFIEILSL